MPNSTTTSQAAKVVMALAVIAVIILALFGAQEIINRTDSKDWESVLAEDMDALDRSSQYLASIAPYSDPTSNSVKVAYSICLKNAARYNDDADEATLADALPKEYPEYVEMEDYCPSPLN